MIDTSKIQNIHLLTNIFGRFPTFHDAEVHQINLTRGEVRSLNSTLAALIHLYEMTAEVDENRKYILKNHVLVDFRFSKATNIEIVGFNHQNVLQSLSIMEISKAEGEKAKFEVLFEGIFGVSAEFRCEAISIDSVSPYEHKAR